MTRVSKRSVATLQQLKMKTCTSTHPPSMKGLPAVRDDGLNALCCLGFPKKIGFQVLGSGPLSCASMGRWQFKDEVVVFRSLL